MDAIDLNTASAEKLTYWQESFEDRQVYLTRPHKTKSFPLDIYFLQYPTLQPPFGVTLVKKYIIIKLNIIN